MDLRINNKVAFVESGSQGMGKATTQILAAEGCRVAVVAREQGRITAAVDEIRAVGGTAIGVSTDVATAAGVRSAVDAVRAAFGPLEIVVAQTNDLPTGNFFGLADENFSFVFRYLRSLSQRLPARSFPTCARRGGDDRPHRLGDRQGAATRSHARAPQHDPLVYLMVARFGGHL